MPESELPPDDEMRAFLLHFIQDRKHSEGVDIPAENQRDFLILFGLVQRVRRLTQAYLRLEHAGFANEASILARAALEHAVTAQWAYLTPGGVDRLHVALARAQAQLARGMIGYSNNPEWVELERDLSAAVPEGKGLPHFTGDGGIMAELDSIKFLHATYKVLSQVGHVTHQAALDSILEEGGEIKLRREPETLTEHETLYAMTGFALLGAWVQARLAADAVEIAFLQEAAVRLHIPWRLDVHLPARRRRFPGEDTPGE